MNKPIFRKTALERLDSPEQLDQLMVVTRPAGWLSLLAIGLIILVVVLWGFLGSIPIQVSGQGILLSAAGIHDVVAPQSGLVEDVPVKAGDVIQTGQVVAIIHAEDASLTQVISPYGGRVLELKVNNGGTVERGTPLLSLEGLNAQGQVDLVAVVYVAPAEGKKIRPGMVVQVSPSTVRNKYVVTPGHELKIM